MTKPEVLSIFANIQFLNTRFEMKEDFSGPQADSFGVYLCTSVPDSGDRTKRIRITMDRRFSYFMDRELFISELFEMICQWLRHEAGELFSVAGAHPFDEHRKPTDEFSLIHRMLDIPELRISNTIPNASFNN